MDETRIRDMAEAYTAAWNSGSAQRVAGHYAADGEIVINGGDPVRGRAALTEGFDAFYGDVPGLRIDCQGVRVAGPHAAYLWRLTGRHAGTGGAVDIEGWEEWDLVEDGDGAIRVKRSLGWFDAADYARQTGGA